MGPRDLAARELGDDRELHRRELRTGDGGGEALAGAVGAEGAGAREGGRSVGREGEGLEYYKFITNNNIKILLVK